LLWLWAIQDGRNRLAGKRILHFAPEKALRAALRDNPEYETADLYERGTTYRLDITNIALPDASYDVVIANHILEHVDDDHRAMAEMFRILRPGGTALLTVPINPTRQETYEDATIIEPEQRMAHFNGASHRRFYGLDFSDRLREVGFTVEIFRMTPTQEVIFSLLPLEWLHVATRPDPG
jgi:SAM-dependent methyltransferase